MHAKNIIFLCIAFIFHMLYQEFNVFSRTTKLEISVNFFPFLDTTRTFSSLCMLPYENAGNGYFLDDRIFFDSHDMFRTLSISIFSFV